MDDFGIEYVGERHIHHLRDVLKQQYEIIEDWTGTKFGGINIKWNYAQKHAKRTCQICIIDYIKDLLLRFGHKALLNTQLLPHKHREITYGANPQLAHIKDTSPPLDEVGIKRIQAIVDAVLFYGRAVDNKLLVTLNSIVTQQAAATEAANYAVNQMLDYLATYANDGIVYRASNMILAAHSHTGFHNESK